MKVLIREATEADLPSVLDLYGQPEMDDGRVLPLESAHEIFARMRRESRHRLYVAEVGHQTVGSFALLIMENLAHEGAPSGVIEDVVVRPDWQRRGIGRKMVSHAIGLCRAQGCYKLSLSSNVKRKATHRFYESLGFRRHGYSFRVDLQ